MRGTQSHVNRSGSEARRGRTVRGGAVGTGGVIRVCDLFHYVQQRVVTDNAAQRPVFKGGAGLIPTRRRSGAALRHGHRLWREPHVASRAAIRVRPPGGSDRPRPLRALRRRTLEVDRAAEGVLGGAADRLGEGGVGVDGVDERLGVDLGRLGERELGDEVGDGGADEVGADEGARLGVVDDLDEAVGVAGAEGLRERAEREPADLDGDAGGSGLLLREAERGDLRSAVVFSRSGGNWLATGENLTCHVQRRG